MGHKIPDDFMLMGYGNNVRLSPMVSRLTHVELPYYEMGQAGCKALIDKILYGKDIPSVQKLDAKLIIGKTTR
jgi:DNA-binding LacI/PurR family transcriptional regulator